MYLVTLLIYLIFRVHHAKLDEDWMKHRLKSRLLGEISITSDMQMTPPSWQKVKKSLLMKVKEESEKADLKLNIKKIKIMIASPITSWQIDGENGTSDR